MNLRSLSNDMLSMFANSSIDTNSTMTIPPPFNTSLALGIVLPLVVLCVVSVVLLFIGTLCCAVFRKKRKQMKKEINGILDGNVSRSRTSLDRAHNGGQESTDDHSIPSAEDGEYYMTLVDPGSVEGGHNNHNGQPTSVTGKTSNNKQTTAGKKSATLTSQISQDRYMGLDVEQMEKQYYTHLVEGEQGELSEEYYMPMDLDIQPPVGNQKLNFDNKAKSSPPKAPCKPSPRQPSPLLPPSHQKSPHRMSPRQPSPLLPCSHLKSPHRTSPRQQSPLLPSSHKKSPQQTSPQQTSPHKKSLQQTTPQQTSPHQTSPQQTSPHKKSLQQTTPQQTSPHQTSPCQTSPHQTPPHKPPPRTRPPLLPNQPSEDSVEYENATKWTANVKSPTSPMYANVNTKELNKTQESTDQKGPTPMAMYTNVDIMNEMIEDVYYI